MIQLAFGYLIMLLLMTYNLGLFIAVILGNVSGFILFDMFLQDAVDYIHFNRLAEKEMEDEQHLLPEEQVFPNRNYQTINSMGLASYDPSW